MAFCFVSNRESRYLLVLTENYAALPIVQEELLKKGEDPVIIFGSSFPKDQEYTQVPTNIICIVVVYMIYNCHTEESFKLREYEQRTSGAKVNHFIARMIHQLAFTRFAFFQVFLQSM